MSMVKFSPTALNFGYDLVLLVHFLGHPVEFYGVLSGTLWHSIATSLVQVGNNLYYILQVQLVIFQILARILDRL